MYSAFSSTTIWINTNADVSAVPIRAAFFRLERIGTNENPSLPDNPCFGRHRDGHQRFGTAATCVTVTSA